MLYLSASIHANRRRAQPALFRFAVLAASLFLTLAPGAAWGQ